MSVEEKNKIDVLIAKFDDHAQSTKTELENIKRGVYGDPINGAPGLNTRVKILETKVYSHGEAKKKMIWWGGGLFVGLQACWYFFLKWLSNQG